MLHILYISQCVHFTAANPPSRLWIPLRKRAHIHSLSAVWATRPTAPHPGQPFGSYNGRHRTHFVLRSKPYIFARSAILGRIVASLFALSALLWVVKRASLALGTLLGRVKQWGYASLALPVWVVHWVRALTPDTASARRIARQSTPCSPPSRLKQLVCSSV